jgi:hypothetical protein
MTYRIKERAERIIDSAHQDASKHGTSLADNLAFECGILAGQIRKLCDELATYTGEGYKPSAGTDTMEVFAEDASFLIEFEFSPGTESKTSGPPEDCYEGDPTEVGICAALVNGEWVDPVNVFKESVLEKWEQDIIDAYQDSVENQRAEYEISRAEARRDDY